MIKVNNFNGKEDVFKVWFKIFCMFYVIWLRFDLKMIWFLLRLLLFVNFLILLVLCLVFFIKDLFFFNFFKNIWKLCDVLKFFLNEEIVVILFLILYSYEYIK